MFAEAVLRRISDISQLLREYYWLVLGRIFSTSIMTFSYSANIHPAAKISGVSGRSAICLPECGNMVFIVGPHHQLAAKFAMPARIWRQGWPPKVKSSTSGRDSVSSLATKQSNAVARRNPRLHEILRMSNGKHSSRSRTIRLTSTTTSSQHLRTRQPMWLPAGMCSSSRFPIEYGGIQFTHPLRCESNGTPEPSASLTSTATSFHHPSIYFH